MKIANKDYLATASMSYLLLPNLLFVAHWLRLEIALLIVVVLSWVVFKWIKQETDATYMKGQNAILLAATALGWTLFCGIGEVGFQQGDYYKHNLIYYDLITRPWPIVYENNEYSNPILCYYTAYYLPTAAAAKVIGGLAAARYYSIVWGFLGVWIGFLWIYRLTGQYSIWIVMIFMLASGLDVITNAIFFLKYLYLEHDVKSLKTIAIEQFFPDYQSSMRFSNKQLTHRLLFSSHFSDLQWVPQHAIGVWVGGGWLFDELFVKKRGLLIGWIGSLLILWSPFVVIGFLPFILLGFVRFPKIFFSFQNLIAGGALGIIGGIYFQSHLPQQYPFDWLFTSFNGLTDWLGYFYFLVVEIIIISVVLGWVELKYQVINNLKPLIWLSAVSLVSATWIVMGHFNDFAMRTSLPGCYGLTLLLLYALTNLITMEIRWKTTSYFWLLLVLSTYEPLREIAWTLVGTKSEVELDHRSIELAPQGLYAGPDVSRFRQISPGWNNSIQYLGHQDSFFGMYLMKK